LISTPIQTIFELPQNQIDRTNRTTMQSQVTSAPSNCLEQGPIANMVELDDRGQCQTLHPHQEFILHIQFDLQSGLDRPTIYNHVLQLIYLSKFHLHSHGERSIIFTLSGRF
jgi:hypothetical protein